MESHRSGLAETLNQHLTTGLLVAAAFIIGMLVTEVRYLKKGGSVPVVADPAAAAAPAAPTAAVEEWNADQLKKLDPITDADHIRGNKDAKLTLVEYSDFECPFCQRYAATIDQLLKEFGADIRVVYRHFPLSFHQYAQKAAEASECAAKLGGNEVFWKFHDLYFQRTQANGTGFPQDKLADLAAEAGVKNKAAFQQCLDSDEMAQKVKDQLATGTTAGVQGTPGTIFLTKDGRGGFINGAQSFENLKPELEKYL